MKKLIVVLCLVLSGNIFAQTGYEKSIELGASIGTGTYSNSAFGISMINGYRFNQHFFSGIGIGLGYSSALNGVSISNGLTTEYRTDAYLIPIFVNVKAYLSTEKAAPFVQLNTGYTFDVNQYVRDAPGFMIEPSFGIDFKMNDRNSFYMLAGLNLQHSKYSYNKDVGSINWEISTKSEMLTAISFKVGARF